MQMNGENQTYVLKFANGFPPGRVIGKVCGGYFIPSHRDSGRKSPQRFIPPLARGRGKTVPSRFNQDELQFTQSKRIKSVPPFDMPERPGFPPQNILHSKPPPKMSRSDPQVFSPPPTVAELKAMTKKIGRFYTVEPPVRTENELLGSRMSTTSPIDQQNSVLQDMEHAISHHELSGLEEVYQRVLKGNKETLHNFISQARRPLVKSVSSQYIKTSTPILIRKTLKSKNSLEALGFSKFEQEAKDSKSKDEMNSQIRPVLVPLAFFPSDAKPEEIQQKQKQKLYEKPHVYPASYPRTSPLKPAGEPYPSIINIDVAKLPDTGKSSSYGAFVGSSVGHPVRSVTGKHLVPILSTPPSTPKTDRGGKQEREEEELNDKEMKDDKMPLSDKQTVERNEVKLPKTPVDVIRIRTADLLSEITEISEGKSSTCAQKVEEGHDTVPTDINAGDVPALDQDKDSLSERLSVSVSLNVTSEDGEEGEIEIYDPEQRDIEKEKEIAENIQKSIETGIQKNEEVKSLIDDYNSIAQEIKELQDDLSRSQSNNSEAVADEESDQEEWNADNITEDVKSSPENMEKVNVEDDLATDAENAKEYTENMSDKGAETPAEQQQKQEHYILEDS